MYRFSAFPMTFNRRRGEELSLFCREWQLYETANNIIIFNLGLGYNDATNELRLRWNFIVIIRFCQVIKHPVRNNNILSTGLKKTAYSGCVLAKEIFALFTLCLVTANDRVNKLIYWPIKCSREGPNSTCRAVNLIWKDYRFHVSSVITLAWTLARNERYDASGTQ